MPLSETNSKQSKSIEDLIAQLDKPEEDCASRPDELLNRRIIKGKRNGAGNSNGNTFAKAASFGNNSEPVLAKNIIMSKKYSTHKRSLNNRGQPKKNMAGGKGVWGKPGCELDEDYLDAKDPNYDSDEEARNVVMVCVDNEQAGAGSSDQDSERKLDELTLNDLDTEIRLVVLEYFQNGDTVEVIDHLKCYDYNKLKQQLIAYLIQIALENNSTSKELMSRLLRDLKLELFDESDFIGAFNILIDNFDDLVLDNPEAPKKIGTFIARAIADKVIQKNYLDANHATGDERKQQAINSARLLVNMNDHLFQLSHIWGNKGGFLAVKELTDKINELIQEYYDSGDVDEAIRCLKELDVPHFHHELVYDSLDFLLQKGNGHAIDLIVTLLDRLCQAVIVTYDQLKIGFTRIFDVLPDISLDVPNANNMMDTVLLKCREKGFVGEDIMDLAPNKSRKRFVSEGDGGRFKEESGH